MCKKTECEGHWGVGGIIFFAYIFHCFLHATQGVHVYWWFAYLDYEMFSFNNLEQLYVIVQFTGGHSNCTNTTFSIIKNLQTM